MPGISPNYLVRHRQILYFRRVVPCDLVPLLGKREIRASLQTAYLSEARRLSCALYARTEDLFYKIRLNKIPMPISEAQIRAIIDQWISDETQKAEADMLMRNPPHSTESLQHHLLCLEYVRDIAHSASLRHDFRPFAEEAKDLLSQHNLDKEVSEIDFRRICIELAKASYCFCNSEMDRINGRTKLDKITCEHTESGNDRMHNKKISTIAIEYKNDKISSKEWSSNSIKDFAKVELFIDLIGDKDAANITIDDIRIYKQRLMNMPKNWNKMPAYREKEIGQILKMTIPDDDKLSTQSIKNHFMRIKAFLSWAKTQKYIPNEDYSALLNVQSKKRAIEQRSPFSDQELQKIFNPKTYIDECTSPSRFWIPILALYTGCRLEELCQLHTSDIIVHDDMHCIFIRDDATDQSIKNIHSRRIIPLHYELINVLDFIKFVSSQRIANQNRLFPELTKNNSAQRYGHNISKWFGRYKTKIGIGYNAAEGTKVFHSFRHSVSAKLNALQVREHIAAALLGHQHERLTYGLYGEIASPEMIFKEAISKIKFNIKTDELASLYNQKFTPPCQNKAVVQHMASVGQFSPPPFFH